MVIDSSAYYYKSAPLTHIVGFLNCLSASFYQSGQCFLPSRPLGDPRSIDYNSLGIDVHTEKGFHFYGSRYKPLRLSLHV